MNYLVKFFKTMPIALAIVVILLVIIVLLSLAGVDPLWPAFFCLFYFTSLAAMDIKRVPTLAVSGALGLFGGFIGILVPGTPGTILLLVWLFLLLTLGVMTEPAMPLIDAPFMFLMLTVATAITGVCAASPALGIWISYIVGVALMALIGGIMYAVASRAAKKAAEAGETGEAEVAEASEAAKTE